MSPYRLAGALAARQPAHDGRHKRAAQATVAIRRPDGEVVQDAAIGDGPVDAIFKAVERVTGVHANLHEFVVRSVTQGKDAQGEVTLEVEVEATTAASAAAPPPPTSSRPPPWPT